MKESDYVGKKFNKLLAIEKVKKNGRCWYLCQCDCGNKKIIAGWRLKSGYTKSCGCLHREADKYRNKDKRLEWGLSNARYVIGTYKRNARKRNIIFDLSEVQCLGILKRGCYYCRRQPFSVSKRKNRYGEFVYSGMDRKNNDIGYLQGNVVPCCKNCNHMKKDMSVSEFLNIVTLIFKKKEAITR